MTWPEPPHPNDGLQVAILSATIVMIIIWLASPVFNYIMRVLQ